MLDRSVTLRDLWRRGELYKPAAYLDGVFRRYKELSQHLGECKIRIGVIGNGHSPNYRFEPAQTRDIGNISEYLARANVTDDELKDKVFWENAARAFNGRSHKHIPLANGVLDAEHWSDPPMSYTDLILLQNDVAQSEKKARKAILKR